jgi:hypothetical protein
MSDPRVHWNLRVHPSAKADAAAEAVRESQRTGVRWNASKVGRVWLALGREAWLKQRADESKI